jgi:hypothetical protein
MLNDHTTYSSISIDDAGDKLVEKAATIELLNPQTRITRQCYKLGWPSSPRDTITISKSFFDATTLIDVSTSLPRFDDSPAFLRPAPPYQRTQLHLLAFCLQLVPPPIASTSSTPSTSKLRLTIFWQWSLKGALFEHRQISSLLSDFVDYVRKEGHRIPIIANSGRSIQLGSSIFDRSQDMLKVGYSIVEDDGDVILDDQVNQNHRWIELSMAAGGWDIKIDESNWTVEVEAQEHGRIIVRISHNELSKVDIVRIKLSIQRLAGSQVIKVNNVINKVVKINRREVPPAFEDDTASITTTTSQADIEMTEPIPMIRTIPGIESSLRRSYIYFTSLLQEPEAKWRAISDSQGVTVTQLNSIDPTLTIYRAEATFVGVGVWDVFSTICSPGARAQWDRTMDDAVLLEDVNELSSLWHIKTKAAWPAVPRDSVTIRTAYKSPSSVHIFSFSTDDTHLFPSIPAVTLPTIRTQTDLYGWAIEALSPTTTQITLLDQSDSKGWSNKSWTPAQMINAVAGVGAFSVKFGGPPVVTRLLGAKATLSKYDHEKGTLKVEYKAATIVPSTVDLVDETIDLVDDETRSSFAAIDSNSTIECEIRCDSNTWASSIDIIVDPPPSKISCLSRHRLSSGGGLWITIEHSSIMVGDERIVVAIRRGPSGREKGSVTVNGAKSIVDVEELPEDEVRLLSKRKRVKASPIPLDQYSTHIPRVGRSLSPVTTILDTQSIDQVVAAPPPDVHELVPIEAVEDLVVTPSSPPLLYPPSHALEALSWLQTFHAEQGPDFADPAPGWTIVSERTGITVRKKMIPRISEVLPVYRGDKIVQGLSADSILSLVSASGCRSTWDERIELATPLTSYGYGVKTDLLATKPVFPFKGRLFHVASVNATVRVPSASATSSTSSIYFSASASFPPDETFDQKRINPTGLLPGSILLEGWILETLDPYSSSILAIPSTRCTYVSCVDHSGSVPFALNSVLNGNLARIINAVETLGRSRGPLPLLQTPTSALQIEGPLSDEAGQDCVWQLSNSNKKTSVLLSADFSMEDGTFRSLYKVLGSGLIASTIPLPVTPPVAARLPPMTTTTKIDLPRSISLTFGSLPVTPNLIVPLPVASLHRQSSTGSLRLKSTSTTTDLPFIDDFVVAELIVDLKQFPNGYAIICSSCLISADAADRISLEPIQSLSLAARQVPLKATVHDAPLPPIVSASLDASKRQNHLVRILIPTSSITNPVEDPLRQSKAVQPDWFKRLIDRGTVVDVRIVPLPADPTASVLKSTMRVTFNGDKLSVATQQASKLVLSRMEDEDWYPIGAKISR